MTQGENEGDSKAPFRWKRGVAIILLFAVAVYFVKVISSQPEADLEKPVDFSGPVASVTAVAAKLSDFPVYLSGLGTVTALRTVTVRSRVDGELIRIAFKEGQMVQQGYLLAKLDPRAFQVQLMQAEGQLLRDEALLKNAQIDLVRYKTLLAQDSIAAQQSVTQASLVSQYQGAVAMDRGLVASAKLQLSYTRITVPISGRLGLRLVDQGNMVKAFDVNGLVVITQIQPIMVVFTLPEGDLQAVMKPFRSGKALTLEAYDRRDEIKLAEGQLVAVDNQIDTSTSTGTGTGTGTGTVKLKGQFANDDGALFANQFVNNRILMEILHSVTVIPNAAIQRGTAGPFVYVVKDDQTVRVRPLNLGPMADEQAVVREGLQLDEMVVVEGAGKLREGMKVKLVVKDWAAGQRAG